MKDLDFCEEFAIRLQIAMLKRHVKAADLTKALNVSRQRFNLYKNGNQSPPLHILARIATLLNVSSDYLLGLEDFT